MHMHSDVQRVSTEDAPLDDGGVLPHHGTATTQ